MPRRKKPEKPVSRRVELIVGGRTIRTIKTKLTIAAAIREIGGTPLNTEGRLMATEPITFRRTIVRGVRVVLVYQCSHGSGPTGKPMTREVNVRDAVDVIRAHLAG